MSKSAEDLLIEEDLMQMFREALSWGCTYGPMLSAEDWVECRDLQASRSTEKVLRHFQDM